MLNNVFVKNVLVISGLIASLGLSIVLVREIKSIPNKAPSIVETEKPVENVMIAEEEIKQDCFGGRTKQEVVKLAAKEGFNINQLKAVSAYYDLICYGDTDVELSPEIQEVESPDPIVITKQPSLNLEDFNKRWEQDRLAKEQKEYQECQQKMIEYNSCLAEYNAKLTEDQNCSLNGGFICSKPYNTCSKPWCL